MSKDDSSKVDNRQVDSSRRDFLKKAGKSAVIAPAAGVILSAAQSQALARVGSGPAND